MTETPERKSEKDPATMEPTNDEEAVVKKKPPFPKQIAFIFGNEFCEKYASAGYKAILGIYFLNVLKYEETDVVVILSAFAMMVGICPFLGAIIADSWLGKYRTILYLSAIYAVGNILLSLTAMPPLHFPQAAIVFIALLLASFGSGGIKPCVSAFGADQFVMPEQEKYMVSYFHFFYFIINAGSVIAMFVTPLLRTKVRCFGEKTCYSLAFGIPAILMIISIVIFMIGKPFYTMKEPKENVFFKMIRMSWYALKGKWNARKKSSDEKKKHWLDYAEDKYEASDIKDWKVELRFLKLIFVPLPIFFALYAQEAARWVFQAQRMDGFIAGWQIYPDQTMMVNPLSIFFLIPLFDRVVYPLFGKCGLLKKPLQRLVVGGILAALACVVAGIVELELMKTYPTVLAEGEAHLQLVNMLPEELNGELYNGDGEEVIPGFQIRDRTNYIVGPIAHGENFLLQLGNNSYTFGLHDQEASTILLSDGPGGIQFTQPLFKLDPEFEFKTHGDVLEKHPEVYPYLRIIQFGIWEDPGSPPDPDVVSKNSKVKITFEGKDHTQEFEYDSEGDHRATPTVEMEIKEYNIYVVEEGKDRVLVQENLKLNIGGSYTVTMIRNGDGSYSSQANILTQPNSMHVLWMLPQLMLISVAEVMFMITIMEFSYKEAPDSLKSITQSVWMLASTIGQLIVILIAESQAFKELWQEYFLYAGIMLVDIFIFAVLAYYYKPNSSEESDKDQEVKIKGSINNNDVGTKEE